MSIVYENESAENLLTEEVVYVLRNGEPVPEIIPDDTEVNADVCHD